jgi:hypothetical protein
MKIKNAFQARESAVFLKTQMSHLQRKKNAATSEIIKMVSNRTEYNVKHAAR